MQNSPGCFITIEGGEGVGKTTNLAFIRQTLEKMGREVVLTREPGGTKVAEEIREIVLQTRTTRVSTGNDMPLGGNEAIEAEALHHDAELLLIFAARAQHIHHVILPALNTGKVVVSDRFTDATFAYQGGGRGISETRIAELEHFVQQGLQPDLTILLDAPVATGMSRVKKRHVTDRIEAEKLEFFERVRNAYLKRQQQDKQRVKVVDASRTLAEVRKEIGRLLDELASSF